MGVSSNEDKGSKVPSFKEERRRVKGGENVSLHIKAIIRATNI